MIDLLRNKKAALEKLDKSLKNRSEHITIGQQQDHANKESQINKKEPADKDKPANKESQINKKEPADKDKPANKESQINKKEPADKDKPANKESQINKKEPADKDKPANKESQINKKEPADKDKFKDNLKTDSLIELDKINWQEELNIDE
ncbi:hypothetical protein BHO_0094601 [Borrelia hermsii YBT]|nr:hypothetical protein BHO_0094601 [Borrelia hermsii YBT]